jgi:hypothetical protein
MQVTTENRPNRNAQRRLRNNRARGSATRLTLSATVSAHSLAVSMPRCNSERYPLLPSGFTAIADASYC